MDYPPQLVLRVNEVYHDVEGARYEHLHPEIFEDEAARWRSVAANVFGGGSGSQRTPVVVLDIGTGSGFVPMQIRHALRSGDTLIAADLSAAMLDVCRRNLEAAGMPCAVEYRKLDGRRLDVADNACTHVTMNSVLHHIPDLSSFFREVDRVLAPGGRIIIGHEPNRTFYRNRLLRLNQQLAWLAFAPRQFFGSVLRRLGLMNRVRRLIGRMDATTSDYGAITKEVNARLLQEGSIDRPLTPDQLTSIVDIHSPTAGGFHPQRGIDLPSLAAAHLPGYAIEEYQTYNHLGDRVSSRNALTRRYDRLLRQLAPRSGATLMAVVRKPQNA